MRGNYHDRWLTPPLSPQRSRRCPDTPSIHGGRRRERELNQYQAREHRVELYQLRTFVTVAEQGHVTQAAEIL
ncbi:MAG: hypothetical protein ACRETL_01100, partial [Gammaproteobacteria bacterium]